MNTKQLTLALSGCALTFASCGGSSSTGVTAGIEGLETPKQISVVTAADSNALGAGGGIAPGAGGVTFPQDSDFMTDEADIWVYDPSVEPISTVNEILCMVSQTRAGAMINEGPYLAQINTERCEQGSADDSSSGQSSGNTTAYEVWTVDAIRANNNTAQNMHVWVPNDEGPTGVPNVIHVDASVRAGASAANPFGVFDMDFAGIPENFTSADAIADPSIIDFTGTLSTLDADDGFIGFTFYQRVGAPQANPGDDFLFQEIAVNVQMTDDETSGFAKISDNFEIQEGPFNLAEDDEFLVAFNETHFKRTVDGGTTEVCLSRDDFVETVWRYNLYFADETLADTEGSTLGGIVERNGGFGFHTEADGGDFGWIGYWGMWVPEDVTIANGDTIYRENYDDPTADPETYTVQRAPGRLIHYAQKMLDLPDIAGKSFEWFGFFNDGQENVEGPFLIRYDTAPTAGWFITHQKNHETYEFEALDNPVELDTEEHFWLGMWSGELGGPVNFVHGDDFVTLFEQEFVTGSSDLFDGGITSLTLHGYINMLDSGISQNDAESGDIFLPEVTDTMQPYEFTFALSDLTLRDANTDPVGLDPAVTQITMGPNTWGMHSGPMVLAADSSSLNDVYEVFGLTEYFVWETGVNDWNQFTGVVDSEGMMVAFDPPLQFQYTHTTANDRDGDATYDGQTFFLNYDGPGNLWGIPHEGFDTDGDMEEDRWYPLFNLADGVLVGPGGQEYVVKAIEMEQRLAEVALADCTGLDVTDADALVLPDASAWDFPDIGDPPTVTDPPAVIDGVLQRADS